MPEPRFTARALGDLLSIFRYGCDRWDGRIAYAYLESFDPIFAMLATNPRVGRARPDIGRSFRSLTHRSHLIVYRVEFAEVVVARVLHGRMDVPAKIKKRR